MNKLLKAILVITLASVLAAGFTMAGCSSNSTTPTVGNPAPDFQFYNPEEEPISLSDLRGKPVMLNFWATWCGPCVSEMPYIQQVYEEWSARGLVLLAINIGETSSQVEEFLQNHNLSVPVLLDTRQVIAQKYSIRAIPTTFFIDKDGIIQAMKVGPFPNKEAIESELNKIMP